MEQQNISYQELILLVGDKEVQLALARGKVAQAMEVIKTLQARIAELEKKD